MGRIVLFLIGLLLMASGVMATIIQVGPGQTYTTIQAAINAATSGDVIEVAAGTYNEDILVNKTLTISGAGQGQSIITGPLGGSKHTVSLDANNIVFEGFTVTRAGNNTTDWGSTNLNDQGILITQLKSGCTIQDCEVTGNRNGIYLNNTQGHTIKNNNIHFNRTGIQFVNDVSNCVLHDNDITDNWTMGVLFYYSAGFTNISTGFHAYDNNISGNWYSQVESKTVGANTTTSYNFRSNWFGNPTPVVTTNPGGEPGYAAQIPVAYGGTESAPATRQGDITGDLSALIDYDPWWADAAMTTLGSNLPVTNITKGLTYSTIQAAINDASAGDVISVAAGTYGVASTILIDEAVTITGPAGGGAIVQGTDAGVVPVFEISSSHVTLQNLEVTHTALSAGLPNPWVELNNSLIRIPAQASKMDAIQILNNKIYVPAQAGAMGTWNAVALTVGTNAVSSVNIDGNTVYNTRNGIIIRSGNTATVSNNVVFHTKGGIMNYTSNLTDGSRTMTGNNWTSTEAGIPDHNEWDMVWNTSGTYTSTDWPLWYQTSVLALSNANNGAYVVDRRGEGTGGNTAGGNRSHIFVDVSSSFNTFHSARGNFNEPFSTIALGITSVVTGGTVYVAAGNYAENVVIDRGLTMHGANTGIACGSRGTESTISPLSGLPVTISGNGVTMNGFEITAPGYQYAINCGNTSNTSILFNNIHDVGTTLATNTNVHSVIYTVANGASTTNLSITDNCFSDISSSNLTGFSASAIGILQSTSTGVLTGLDIERNIINGVTVNTGTWPTGKIAYGIQINTGGGSGYLATTGEVVNATLANNEISNIIGFIATGIGLEGNTLNAQVKNNRIANLTGHKAADRNGGGYDLQGLKFENNRYLATCLVEDNKFETNTYTNGTTIPLGYAVANYVPVGGTYTGGTTGAATLGCNWYGTSVDSEIADNANLDGKIFNKDNCQTNYLPYLTDGTDADPVTLGFQPQPNACGGGSAVANATKGVAYNTIQEAIDAANDGDLIVVSLGGTYAGVIFDESGKSITLQNTSGATVTIQGASPALTVTSGTLTVDGITYTTATNDPTVLVNGGSLIMRNCKVEESTGFTQSGISVSSGSLDAGTGSDHGYNTFVNDDGLALNVTGGTVTAIGNYWGTVDPTAVAALISGTTNYSPWCNEDFSICGYTAGSPVTTIGIPTEVSCGVYDFPVTVQNFNNIGAISLTLNYDPAVLSYTSVTLNTAITGAPVSNPLPGTFILGYFESTGGSISLADDAVLFTLRFTLLPAASGAASILSWNTSVPAYCEYGGGGPNFDPYVSAFINLSTWNIPVRPVKNVNTSLEYCKIQEAIDATETVNGHVITVAAGVYAEDLLVDKSLDIRGPNFGVSPNASSRLSEAIIHPATSSPYGEIIQVKASNVSINGFTINGDNPSLTSGFLGTNGADLDAAEAVTVYDYGVGDPAVFSLDIHNLKVENNIIENLTYFGVTIFGWNNYANPPSSGHVVSNNLIRNMGTYDAASNMAFWGGGVLIYNDMYTRITDNVMQNVRLGIQTGNFHDPNPGDAMYQVIDNNQISARRIGIFYNLHTGNPAPLTLSNNTISAIANNNETRWRGITFSSLSNTSGIATNNTITVASPINQASAGYDVWNVHSNAPALVSGGSVTGADIGVFANNFEGYSSDATSGAHASLTGVTINNPLGVGIRVYDSPSSTSHANVSVSAANCNITSLEGIKLEETQPGTVGGTFTGNTINAGAIGVNVTGLVTSTTNGLNISGNNITLSSQLTLAGPTVGVSLINVTGTEAATISNNTIDGPYYGYVVYKLNTSAVTTISGGIITGVMQGVSAFNLNTNAVGAPSTFNLDDIDISDFAGNYPAVTGANFHAGVYVFTGGASSSTDMITMNINDLNVNGTGRIAQDCAGMSFADFSAHPGIQQITINASSIINNLNRGINARGNTVVNVNTSTLSNNGGDPFGTGGNDGFGVAARYSGTTVNMNNCFLTLPATVTAPYTVTGLFGWDGAIINAHDNHFSQNGNSGYLANAVSPSTMDATCNWWGTSSVTGVAATLNGSITYEPWLSDGTDNDGAVGFQPIPNSCTGAANLYVNDVTWPDANDTYTTAIGADANAGTAAAPFLTITKAVNTAVDGTKIWVDAGTFQEQVFIGKTVDLTGVSMDKTIVKAPATLITQPWHSGNANPVVYASGNANTVNISKLAIDGDGGRSIDNYVGMLYYEANGAFDLCKVSGIHDATSFTGSQRGHAYYGSHTGTMTQTLSITNNMIKEYQKGGIYVRGSGTSATITANTVTGQNVPLVIAQNGIVVMLGATGDVQNNAVTNNIWNKVEHPHQWTAAGILLYQAAGTTVSGNTLSGNELALNSYQSTGVTYGLNTFSNNKIHLWLDAASDINASNVYDKYVLDATNNPEVVFGCIQYAIDEATAGDVLNASAGTFEEMLNVHTQVDLRGPNYNIHPVTGTRVPEAIITFPASLTGYNELIAVGPWDSRTDVDGVSINGFILEGNPLTAGDALGIMGNGDNLVVKNNYIQNFNYIAVHITSYVFETSWVYDDYNNSANIQDNYIHNNGIFSGLESTNVGYGIYLQGTYATVTGNLVESVRSGIQVQPYNHPNTTNLIGTVSGNTFKAYRDAMWFNYSENANSNWLFTGNTGTGIAPPTAITEAEWRGFRISTNYQGNLDFTNNTLTAGSAVATDIHGIKFQTPSTASVVNILDNSITAAQYGVYIPTGTLNLASITIEDNTIASNTLYGVYNGTATPVDASPNWWGDASGPYHATLNPCGLGNAVTDNVDFSPWYFQSGMTTLNGLPPITLSAVPDYATVTGAPVIFSTTAGYTEDMSAYDDQVLTDNRITSTLAFPAGSQVISVKYDGTEVLAAPYDLVGKTTVYLSEILGLPAAGQLNDHTMAMTPTWTITVAGFDGAASYGITLDAVSYITAASACNNVLGTEPFSVTFADLAMATTDPEQVCEGSPVISQSTVTYPSIAPTPDPIPTNPDPIKADVKITFNQDIQAGAYIEWTVTPGMNPPGPSTLRTYTFASTLTAGTPILMSTIINGSLPVPSTPGMPSAPWPLNWAYVTSSSTYDMQFFGLTPAAYTSAWTPIALLGTAEYELGFTGTTTQAFTVNDCGISGVLNYYNNAASLLKNVPISLYQNGSPVLDGSSIPIVSTTDGTTAAYTFPGLPAGTYELRPAKTDEVRSINATDAAQVNYWNVNNSPIEKVRFLAGDVARPASGSSSIVAYDAQQILVYFVSAGTHVWTNAPSWSFYNAGQTISANPWAESIYPKVTITNAPMTNQTIYGMVTGDFNRSWTPSSKGASQSLSLNDGQMVQVAPNTEILLPITAAHTMEVGAISLILTYPDDKVTIDGVYLGNNPTQPMLYNANNGVVRIGWTSPMPMEMLTGNTLITLKLRTASNLGSNETIRFELAADPLNELANGQSQVISPASLIADILVTSTTGLTDMQGSNLQLTCYPNPFTETTTIQYYLPVKGFVTLDLFDLVGQKVTSLVAQHADAGSHSLCLQSTSISSGVYLARITFQYEGKTVTRTIKLVRQD